MMQRPEDILDSYLVLDYQTGNKKALALLVKRWHSKFCRQAFWYTKDADEAKDIAQDSWHQIIKKIQSLKDPNKFGSWSLAIVNRKSIDWTRRGKRKIELLNRLKNEKVNEESVDETGEINHKEVLILIKQLPEQQQIVLRMFYLERHSLDQISEILNISKGTVKSRLFYAREQLKTTLKTRNYEK
jgi:RNA polymerase sigma-70 factor (ECF subfamily)